MELRSWAAAPPGFFLAVRGWSATVIRERLGLIAAGYGVSVLAVLAAIALLRFDPLKSAQVVATLTGLTVYFGLLFSGVLPGGLSVAGAFAWARDAHRLYSPTWPGPATRRQAAAQIIQSLGAVAAMLAIGLCGLAAAAMFGGAALRRWRWAALTGAFVQVGLLLTNVVWPLPPLAVPKSKSWVGPCASTALQRAHTLEPCGARRRAARDRRGRAHDRRRAERAVPPGVAGFGRRLPAPAGHARRHINNGVSASTAICHDLEFHRRHSMFISAPFQVGIDRPRVLNIGVGGGLDILQSHLFNASAVKAIELNPDVVALLTTVQGLQRQPGRSSEHRVGGRRRSERPAPRHRRVRHHPGIGLDNFAALSGGASTPTRPTLFTRRVDRAIARPPVAAGCVCLDPRRL